MSVNKNKLFLFLLFRTTALFFASNISNQEEIQNQEIQVLEEDSKLRFREIWGYVMIGEEKSLPAQPPITDLGYFVNAVNNFSEFVPVPNRQERFPNFNGRIHIVSSVDSKAQTHLLLDPKLPLRNKIIKQLVHESKDYDGVQIDWELVMKDDDENFWSFLKTLKKKLKGKMLTVAIPARTKTLEKDCQKSLTA